jgi:nicotinamide-nucleotide amidase
MTAAILSIGTELSRGELVNTNGPWIAQQLVAIGFEVFEHAIVDDDRARIIASLERLARTASIIVCTGGLGPTTDDLTTEAVASALGVKLKRDEASLEHIRRRFEKLGRTMSESNAKQADFPDGAEILPNPIGTAPGFSSRIGRATAYFMPGVPREMMRMFDEQVTPRIRKLAPNDTYQVHLKTFGLPESVVGEKLAGIEQANEGVIIGYRAHFPEIEVKVLAKAASQTSARDAAEKAAAEVRSRLGDVIYGESEDTFASVVGRFLRTRGLTLAIAESCTGGLVGSMLTREPGASEFLLLDAVTYANSAKTRVLGVDEDVLRAHGAVSHEVAALMAEGARRAATSDVALSLTGVAGPTGGSEEKPVGTVFIGVTGPKGTEVKHHVFPGDRPQIQTIAAYAGLKILRNYVQST